MRPFVAIVIVIIGSALRAAIFDDELWEVERALRSIETAVVVGVVVMAYQLEEIAAAVRGKDAKK